MSKIAVIPARGGSKRIPLKNIKEFKKSSGFFELFKHYNVPYICKKYIEKSEL